MDDNFGSYRCSTCQQVLCEDHAKLHLRRNRDHSMECLIDFQPNMTVGTPSVTGELAVDDGNDCEDSISVVSQSSSFCLPSPKFMTRERSLSSISNGATCTSCNNCNGTMCHIHSFPIDTLCKTCNKTICARCAITKDHKGHDCYLLEDIEKEERQSVNIFLDLLSEKVSTWEVERSVREEDLNQKLESIERNRARLIETIEKKMNELKEIINERQNQLVDMVDDVLQSHIDIVHNITETKRKTRQMIDDWRREEVDIVDLINNKEKLLAQVISTVNELTQENMESILWNDVEMSFPAKYIEEFKMSLSKIGEVAALCPCAEQSEICSDDYVNLSERNWKQGDELEFKVLVKNQDCNILADCPQILHCFVQGKGGEPCSKSFDVCFETDKGESYYRLKTTIPVDNECNSSEFQIHVMLQTSNGLVHVLNSPVDICVSNDSVKPAVPYSGNFKYVDSVGTGQPGTNEGQLNCPSDVKIFAKHKLIVVCDWNNKRVQGLDLHSRKYSFTICTQDKPRFVAVDPNDDSIIVSSSDHTLTKFNIITKEMMWKIGTEGPGPNQFNFPMGVVTDTEGRIYVSDHLNNRIHVISSHGDFLSTLSCKGSEDGELSGPFGIDLFNNMLYVSDQNNHRIQIMNLDGSFVGKFGKHGSGPGELKYPRGISVDKASGNIAVCDCFNHRVCLFDPKGVFLTCFGSFGTNIEQQFKDPFSLTIDPTSGQLIMCDYWNYRLKIFE